MGPKEAPGISQEVPGEGQKHGAHTGSLYFPSQVWQDLPGADPVFLTDAELSLQI